MCYKISHYSNGDPDLTVDVNLSNREWLAQNEVVGNWRPLLPKSNKPIAAEVINDVEDNGNASFEDFG